MNVYKYLHYLRKFKRQWGIIYSVEQNSSVYQSAPNRLQALNTNPYTNCLRFDMMTNGSKPISAINFISRSWAYALKQVWLNCYNCHLSDLITYCLRLSKTVFEKLAVNHKIRLKNPNIDIKLQNVADIISLHHPRFQALGEWDKNLVQLCWETLIYESSSIIHFRVELHSR